MAKNGKNGKNGSSSKALVKVGDAEFAVLTTSPEQTKELIETNVGPIGLTPLDLERIHVPSGGGTQWEIGTLSGSEMAKAFDAVIVHAKDGRIYWAEPFGQGDRVPNCVSNDGLVGHGDPGGHCAECPYSQFGSDEQGSGQACKQVKQLFLFLAGDRLPRLLSVPPTSLKPMRKYMLRLASAGKAYYAILTRFELEKTQSRDGIEYAVITPTMAQELSDEQAAFFRRMKEALEPSLDQTAPEAGDVPAGDSAE